MRVCNKLQKHAFYAFFSKNCKWSTFLQIPTKWEKKVFYAFSAVSFNNPYTHYKIITKPKKNSVLHTFMKHNAETCENKAFEAYFALFTNMCETCTLCKIITKCAKTLFCRSFSRIVRKSWKKRLFRAFYAFCSESCKS